MTVKLTALAGFRYVAVFVVVFLCFSFVLHDVVSHHHPGESLGVRTKMALHSKDKEWWYFLLLISLIVAIHVLEKLRLEFGSKQVIAFALSYVRINVAKIFNPVLQALRIGLLHPKLCA